METKTTDNPQCGNCGTVLLCSFCDRTSVARLASEESVGGDSVDGVDGGGVGGGRPHASSEEGAHGGARFSVAGSFSADDRSVVSAGSPAGSPGADAVAASFRAARAARAMVASRLGAAMRATARFAATTSAPCVATVARTLEYSFGFFCKLAQLFVELGTNPTPSSNAAVLARQYDAPTFTAMFTAGRLNKCCGECGGEDDNCENARHAASVAERVELLRVFHTDATSKLDECNGDVAAATAASELYARLNKLICGRAIAGDEPEGPFPLSPTALVWYHMFESVDAVPKYVGDRASWYNLLYDTSNDVATTALCPRAWESHLDSLFTKLLLFFVPEASPWPPEVNGEGGDDDDGEGGDDDDGEGERLYKELRSTLLFAQGIVCRPVVGVVGGGGGGGGGAPNPLLQPQKITATLCKVLTQVYGRLPKTPGGSQSSSGALQFCKLLVFSVPFAFNALFSELVKEHISLRLAFNLACSKYGSSGPEAVGLATAGLALGDVGRALLDGDDDADPTPLSTFAVRAAAPLFGALGSPAAVRVSNAVCLMGHGAALPLYAGTEPQLLHIGMKRLHGACKSVEPLYAMPYKAAAEAGAISEQALSGAAQESRKRIDDDRAMIDAGVSPRADHAYEQIKIFLNAALGRAGVGLHDWLVRRIGE